ncbi:MAG: response regulator [Bacteroidota bacterium]
MNEGELFGKSFEQLGEKLLQQELKACQAEILDIEADNHEFYSIFHQRLMGSLYNILTLTDLGSAKDDTLKSEDCLPLIALQGRKILDELSQMIELHRMESQPTEGTEKEVKLVDVLENVIQVWKAAASVRKLPISYHIDNGVPLILSGDQQGLEHVLYRVVQYLLGFLEEGEIQIRINGEKKFDGGIILDVSIQCFSSMKPESLEQAWEKTNYTFDWPITFAQRRLSLMNGEFGWRNPPAFPEGQNYIYGTEFWFTLPMKRISDNQPEPQATSIPTHNIMVPAEGKILVVEDNPVNQLIIARNLSNYGFEVQVADHGGEAISLLQEQPFDIIFMDINMPVMDGIRATRIIRQEINDSIPIISVTSNVFESEKRRYQEVGMDDYLHKPFRRDQLIKMVKKHLPAHT